MGITIWVCPNMPDSTIHYSWQFAMEFDDKQLTFGGLPTILMSQTHVAITYGLLKFPLQQN